MNSNKLAVAEESVAFASSSTTDAVDAAPHTFGQWWRSDWGPGPLIKIALPLMMSTGFMSLTLFTDRTLLYWQSESSASAAMGGGALYWTISCLPLGLLGYLSTFVSQYRGAGQNSRVGAAYQHAMALAWLMVPFFLILALLSGQIFKAAGHDPDLVRLEANYLSILLLGGIAILFYNVQSGLLTGQGRTGIVLAVEAIATVINLVLDIVLIFGWGPIPELGLSGAALATAISFWLKLPIMTWIIKRDVTMRDLFHVGRKVPWETDMFKRLVVFGTPAGLQMLAEAGCFSLIMLQVGRLGKLEMAATTLALGLNVLAFVPMIGLGISVGVLVGQHLTEGRVDLARRTVWSAIGISTCYTSVFAATLGLFPVTMASSDAWGTSAARYEVMETMLICLLW